MPPPLFLGQVPAAQRRAWQHVRDAYPRWHHVADDARIMRAYEALVRKEWAERRLSPMHGWEYRLSPRSLVACGLPPYGSAKSAIAKGLRLNTALVTDEVQAGTHVAEFHGRAWTQICIKQPNKTILFREWDRGSWMMWDSCWVPLGTHFLRTAKLIALADAELSPYRRIEQAGVDQ